MSGNGNGNGSVKKIRVGLKFDRYIGMPYWPELDLVINVSKDVHPKLGPAKKEAALNAALEKRNMTREQYDRAVKRSQRPFYTDSDNDEGSGEIVIPARVIQSFLNHASQQAPKVVPRIPEKGLTFIGVKMDGDRLKTGKTVKDAQEFFRYVKNQESNQRQACSSSYISDFIATGIMYVDEEAIGMKADDLRKLFEYGGKFYGVGSARPQGFGRFQVAVWDQI